MSATLQALGRTLRQVGELTSERFAAGGMRQRAMLLSGAIALAAAAPVHAQTYGQTITSSASAGYGQAQNASIGQPYAQGQVNQTQAERDANTRTTGRVVGGVLGFVASAATTKNTWGRLASTAVGAVIGGSIADSSVKADQAKRQSAQAQQMQQALSTNALTRFQYEGSGAAPVGYAPSSASVPANVKPLPEALRARLTSMVVESAARRVVAQHQLERLDEAELASVTAPGDLEARAAMAQAKANYQTRFNDLALSLTELNNALVAVSNKGYDVRAYAASLQEMTAKMEGNSPLQLDSPAVMAKVTEIEQAPGATVQLTAARDLQQVTRQATGHAPKMH
ncbi:hypothetical protein QRD43_21300 [Pelomonas sp. APW6]|uniref:Glycine zipper 2TM domain-containing protein n=1 Tax=Roseateles subflavus TaxID=3053353 RepID=A0ABT7LNV9_9BURK|nr:hypothetical protein [Pelomonas sp. APW6]MDL5034454.1 hypothetical protein [Pelomonas sp. APW6]